MILKEKYFYSTPHKKRKSMFTEKDRQRCDSALERAVKIGEKIGDFIHVNAKGLIRILIIVISILLLGGVYMFVAVLKRSFGKKT